MPGDSAAVDALIDRRAAEVLGLDPAHGLPVQFLSYGKHARSTNAAAAAGDEADDSDFSTTTDGTRGYAAGYRAHTDCDLLHGHPFDRTTTLLVYLNDVPEGYGGHTYFPAVGGSGSSRDHGNNATGGVWVRPEKGMALVFRSDTGRLLTADGTGGNSDDEFEPEMELRAGFCDPASLHVAEPLLSQQSDGNRRDVEKHVIQRWYTRRPLPWTSSTASVKQRRQAVAQHLAEKWPTQVVQQQQQQQQQQQAGAALGTPVVFCDGSQSCREYY